MNPDEPTEAIEPKDNVEPTDAAEPTDVVERTNTKASKNMLSVIVSIVTGSIAGIFLHYILYLMSIPQKPFIYAWF